MSSHKKIGRWNRFEVALSRDAWPQTSPFAVPNAQTERKRRGWGKMNENSKLGAATTEAPPVSENAPTEKTSVRDAASSPTLWTEARQKATKAKKRRNQR